MIYPKAFIDDDSLINIFQKSCLPVFFKDVSNINNVRIVGSLKNPMFWGCSKMFRCKARKKPNREAYMDIR